MPPTMAANLNALPLPALRGISSMATRALLAELVAAWTAEGGTPVAIESVGGVDAAKRVRAGEAFDLVFLASDALQRLDEAGALRAGSRVGLFRSPVAVAVRDGAPLPDVGTETALKAAVERAPTIGYSTGPSGAHLQRLFARWGIADAVSARTVTPPPGVPVARLVAAGEVALGFQQLSELQGVAGVRVVGLLPPGADFTTVFGGAVAAATARPDDAAAFLHWLASDRTDAAIRRHGMAPAEPTQAAHQTAVPS